MRWIILPVQSQKTTSQEQEQEQIAGAGEIVTCTCHLLLPTLRITLQYQ